MKKFSILASAILLTAAIYAADTSSITISLFNRDVYDRNAFNMFSLHDEDFDKDEGLRGNNKFQINHINFKTETFGSLAKKVYDKIYRSDELNGTSFYSSRLKKYLPIKQADVEIKTFEGEISRHEDGDTYHFTSFEYSPHDSSTTLDKAGIKNGEEIFTYLVETEQDIKEPNID